MNEHDCFGLYDQRYLLLKSVLELIRVSRSTWYLWIQRGIAPQPTHLSLRVAAWKAQEIKDLLDDIGKSDWASKVTQKMKCT